MKLVYTIISECSAGKSKALNASLAVSICKDSANAIDVRGVQQMDAVDKDEIFDDLFNATTTIDESSHVGSTTVGKFPDQ